MMSIVAYLLSEQVISIFPNSNHPHPNFNLFKSCRTKQHSHTNPAHRRIYLRNDLLTRSDQPHCPHPPHTRALPRHRLPTIHRAHQTKTSLPPPNIPLRGRQPLPPTAPAPPQERVLPQAPAAPAAVGAQETLLRPIRSAQGGMQIRHF